MMQTLEMASLKSITDKWELDNEHFDKDTLEASIIMTGGRFEPVYTDPAYFYMMCEYWWKKHRRTFQKWWDAFDIEYNPLDNYNRHDEIHEDTYDVGTDDTTTGSSTTRDNDTTYSKSGGNTEVMDDDYTTSETGTSHGETDNTVSAYDSSTYQPHDHSTTDNSATKSGSGTDDRTTTNSWNESGSGTDDTLTRFDEVVDNDTTNDKDFDHTGHSWGNIGVTTTQKMLREELEIQAWDIYQHMADMFCEELLLTVY